MDVLQEELKQRLILDNPWWADGKPASEIRKAARRAFVRPFLGMLKAKSGAAVVLCGPGRVGKTVMIKQVIQLLLGDGVAARNLVYIRLDNPAFANMDLGRLVDDALATAQAAGDARAYVFLDDVHNVPDWEHQLEAVAKARAHCRLCAVSGLTPQYDDAPFAVSILPPILFAEYLHILRIREKLFDADGRLADLDGLNRAFNDYVNGGGFPEVAFKPKDAAANPSDVVARVVHRDLAGLCGIADQREVAKLMTRLALETGLETSIETLSRDMKVAKNTLRKYLEFLESAYLIKRIWRVDGESKRFQRQTRFKVYLTSPALRAGFTGPSPLDSRAMALLAETAVISQFMHSGAFQRLFYAFWKKGRKNKHLSLVEMPPRGDTPVKCIELDWGDKTIAKPAEMLEDMVEFIEANKPATASKVLTRSTAGKRAVNGHEIGFMPVSVWCFAVGQVLLTGQPA
ncbi:MAG: ATP-binding protein [Alphaproteobacteria bacterium]|nr:ATP-binding protein [Alphaproteobacteria bacterium]